MSKNKYIFFIFSAFMVAQPSFSTESIKEADQSLIGSKQVEYQEKPFKRNKFNVGRPSYTVPTCIGGGDTLKMLVAQSENNKKEKEIGERSMKYFDIFLDAKDVEDLKRTLKSNNYDVNDFVEWIDFANGYLFKKEQEILKLNLYKEQLSSQ